MISICQTGLNLQHLRVLVLNGRNKPKIPRKLSMYCTSGCCTTSTQHFHGKSRKMQFDILVAVAEVRLPGIAYNNLSRWKHIGSWALFHWHVLIIHYAILSAWLADKIGNGSFLNLFAKLSPWMYLPSFIYLSCFFLVCCLSSLCLLPIRLNTPLFLCRVVSSQPGHPGSFWFVDLILVWCCLGLSRGSNDGTVGRVGLPIQLSDNTSPQSPPLWSDLRADEKQPQRGTHLYRWRFKMWHPAAWSRMGWSWFPSREVYRRNVKSWL